MLDIFGQNERIKELEVHADTVISAKEKERRLKEDQAIQAYIKKLGYPFQKTSSGVYFTYFSQGKGEISAVKGKMVLINFTGKLLNGTQFETTYNEDGIGRPVAFTMGKKEVIKGWEDVMLNKRAGDKIVCIIPSQLAFGPQQKGTLIPSNSPLFFDIDVMDIR